ncbi:MAG TPA: transglutaminaseTgpA domain-containing protein, partial [Tepidisphaeraceae bacterium]|nr:transglutaminaseTgpA domain-containing protein [Tepidisphaeraceae bacterium]
PILTIGQFLVLLQIVKLFEQRANRDYAQLLVLSLLLMVAASISTASLVFGILLIVYLFLSLYCCLLFHLKVETDHARRAIGLPEETLNPATLRQDQRYLSRSMRRLTGLISVFAVTTAVVTFLFFPRGTGAGLLGPLQWKPSQTLTGFSDSVSFQNVARITQNTQIVAYVKLSRNGKPYRTPGPLMLRGLTLNRYSGDGADDAAGQSDRRSGTPYQWTRVVPEASTSDYRPDDWQTLNPGSGDDEIHQQITLEPTGTNVLFAIGGITRFKPGDGGRFRYSRSDEVIQSVEPLLQTIRYEVVSRNRLTRDLSSLDIRYFGLVGDGDDPAVSDGPEVARSRIDPKIEEFARRPEVSGADEQGPLAARRPRHRRVTALDAEIARNIQDYLRTNFSYTLDLTDARRIEGQDPLVAFLYDLKRGHCEYFAGAMALMCQSLGMDARVVVGFKCDEYNPLGGYYVVRQSHAHAWVEVLSLNGEWLTFDPTSGREATAAQDQGLWHRVRSLFNFLEYTWANSVVAYDRESRNNLIQTVDRKLTDTAAHGTQAVNQTRDWLQSLLQKLNAQRYNISSNLIGGLIVLMLLALFGSVVYFVWEKWRLRRRARRIGLDLLPATEQLKLARQLGFYDELIRLLERHHIVRPPHHTPLEFSDSLTYLPTQTFDAVRRLTEVYYRVRYGRAELTPSQRRHLHNVILQVE